jgi:hypothetical protein
MLDRPGSSGLRAVGRGRVSARWGGGSFSASPSGSRVGLALQDWGRGPLRRPQTLLPQGQTLQTRLREKEPNPSPQVQVGEGDRISDRLPACGQPPSP